MNYTTNKCHQKVIKMVDVLKKMGGGMMKKRTMMKAGSNGKLKMVMKGGKKVPFFAADGKGAKDLGKAKMMKGGRVKKMGGGISKLNPGLQAFMKKKMKKKNVMARPGLYANIHAKRKRGGKMRKKGAKGAPTAANFRRAAQTARKR